MVCPEKIHCLRKLFLTLPPSSVAFDPVWADLWGSLGLRTSSTNAGPHGRDCSCSHTAEATRPARLSFLFLDLIVPKTPPPTPDARVIRTLSFPVVGVCVVFKRGLLLPSAPGYFPNCHACGFTSSPVFDSVFLAVPLTSISCCRPARGRMLMLSPTQSLCVVVNRSRKDARRSVRNNKKVSKSVTRYTGRIISLPHTSSY